MTLNVKKLNNEIYFDAHFRGNSSTRLTYRCLTIVGEIEKLETCQLKLSGVVNILSLD